MNDTHSPETPVIMPPPESRPSLWGRLFAWLIAIAVIAGLVWFVRGRASSASGSSMKGGPTDRVIPVTVSTVTLRDIPILLEGIGTVVPIKTVTVRSLVDGQLLSIPFQEGQRVKAGELLAVVDPRPFQVQLHQAQASLAKDQATLRDAQLNLDRYKALRDQNLLQQQQVDDQEALVGQTKASLQADQASIESAQLNLSYSRITSPIEGVTGIRKVDPGNLIHPSDAGGIVVVTQLDPISVIFTLPQDSLPSVSRRMHEGKLKVHLFTRDGVTPLSTGELGLIDNEINTATAMGQLRAFFPNADRTLWPNQFVKARLELETRKNAIAVTTTVIQQGPSGTYAYVVKPDNTVEKRDVKVDMTAGELTLIAQGLSVGDVVVEDGQFQLKPGAKVSINTPKTPRKPAPGASGSATPHDAPVGSPSASSTPP